METAEKVAVMRGKLKEFDLPSILEVMSIGRQYTVLELCSDDHVPVGAIFMKGGKVVSAVAPGAEGKEAFFRLFQKPLPVFHVFRMDTPEPLPEPLGSVDNLVDEALVRLASHQEPAPVEVQQPSVSSPTVVQPVLQQPVVVRQRETEGSPRVILAIASPKGGSGKTTVALNLALSLARQGRSVVLVDGDINGDILSAIDSRESARHGAFDVLLGKVSFEEALLSTVVPKFKILPALARFEPDVATGLSDRSREWRALLQDLSKQAEIVVVDTPAGMFGVTHQILRGCSHVVGIMQSEVMAHRSFPMFAQGIDAVPEGQRPSILGVFLNMLQIHHTASVSVMRDACEGLPKNWLFETSMPRSPAFLDASMAGLPLRLIDDNCPPAVTFLFDALATEVTDRLHLPTPERQRRRLLV